MAMMSRLVPGHALHEKQEIGPVVSSQKRRAAVVPLINRSSTARSVPPFPDMPCMKKVYRDKWVPVHLSAARKEERPSSRG